MIKQIPNNPEILASPALQRYFLDVLPLVDWSHESLRSCKALESLLGRLNRSLPRLLEYPTKTQVRLFYSDFVVCPTGK